MVRRSAFFRELTRSITGSPGRFLAIMGIVALGCGFFAGLQMSGTDMRAAGDAYYDATNLYDLRVISTLGFGDDDIGRLGAIEGITAVAPSRTLDVMARLGHEQLVVRLSELDVEAAKAATTEGDYTVVSDDDSYLNRPLLREGRWPQAADECVISADKIVGEDLGIGSTVEILYGSTELDGVLATREFTVVGLVSSPLYPYTGTFGSTSLGSGIVAQYMLVDGTAFEDDAPYTELYATVDGASAELSESQAYLDVVGAVATRIKDAGDELATARRDDLVRDPHKQVDEGREELESQRADTQARLEEGRAELKDAEARVEELKTYLAAAQAAGNARYVAMLEAYLDEAQSAYDEGVAQLEDAEATAEEEFSKAERELDYAQADIDAIETPEILVLDRTKSEGHVAYQGDTKRMDSIANVFPFMFFLVAALVALTSMTRMVDDDRQLIGTHKALGYSSATIATKYLVYAAIAAGVGAIVGICVLTQVLPYVVTSSYAIIYTVPVFFPLPIKMSVALMAGGLGVAVTLLATLGAVYASLAEKPATLILPRPPAAGKRIFLERVGIVWNRFTFSWKVTYRNLFRYKRRLLMTVVGVAGCTALLLVGFGLHDAIWDIIDCQYGPIVRYNATVGLDDDASEADIEAVEAYLREEGEATGLVRVEQTNMIAASDALDDTMAVSVLVPEDVRAMSELVTFRERVSREALTMSDTSVILTEKLASYLGVSLGDEVILHEQDAIGNATGEGTRFTVVGITENYVANLVYVGRDVWEEAMGACSFSTFLATVDEDADARTALGDELELMDHVSTVAFSSETIDLYRSMLSVVDLVVVVLIVSAGALAFIVLYNLTNINVLERVREIASLKVLGFTRQEVYQYIFREVLVLTVFGDLLGMVLGTFLETFVVTTAEVDYVMFGRTIHPSSYALAFAITLFFALVVLGFMRHKLDRIDMVESLKSVD